MFTFKLRDQLKLLSLKKGEFEVKFKIEAFNMMILIVMILDIP